MDIPINETLQRLRSGRSLNRLAVSSSGFAFDPQLGQSYVINESGMAALALLGEGRSVPEAAAQLAETYAIPCEIARGGVETFLRQLGRYLL